MAARKKSARRKRSGARAAREMLADRLASFERELPPTLRDYAAQVRRRLDRLERELARAQAGVRRQAARLLREASHQLGRLEVRGEAGWRRLAAPYRRQLLDLLRRLERAVKPRAARSRPKARKKTSAARSA
jgi:hypothetical protein